MSIPTSVAAVTFRSQGHMIMRSAAIGPAWKNGRGDTSPPIHRWPPRGVGGSFFTFGRWEPHQFARPHVQRQNFGYKRAAINSQITSTPNQITPVIISAPRRQASSWWLSCLQVIAGRFLLDHPQRRAIEQRFIPFGSCAMVNEPCENKWPDRV
jgi:hypothetical protein